TQEGAVVLEKLIPASRVLGRRLLRALNREEQKQFLHLLKKFVHLNNDESRAPLERKSTSMPKPLQ
ncbi:MAG: MarR family transcriptional regulator, partial [Acidobacteria bacterium]|nr:MarR family transcriptional regulator [Acidobacteriota bacterium]